MKRKDYMTIIGAIIFCVVVAFANTALAHDGPNHCPPKAECEIA